MVNRPKQIGTKAESAVVAACKRLGYPDAYRRTQTGSQDQGDIVLCANTIIEVKGGHAAWDASTGQIDKWLEETGKEVVNANAIYGFLVVQRKGVGHQNADQWWAYTPLTVGTHMNLVVGYPGYPMLDTSPCITIRTTLQQMLTIYTAAGRSPERKP